MLHEGLLAWCQARGGLDKVIGLDDAKLGDLTIVIPSFGRPEYVVRQLAYWACRNVKVIIVDGSKEPIGDELMQLLDATPNVRYLAMDASYVNRVKHACGLIETPYAMCLADDDMLLTTGLTSAIDRLEQTPDVLACMGQVMGLDYDEEKSGAYFFPYGESLEGYEVSDEDVRHRLSFALDGYRTATSYAVYRTQIFKELWLGMDTGSCLEATEYEHSIATYIQGKITTVPHLYWLRSFEAQPVDSAVDGTRRTGFASWWRSERYAVERDEFIERLTARLRKSSDLNESEARETILATVQLILQGKHVGLVNKNRRLRLATGVQGKLYKLRLVRRLFMAIKATRLGRKVRSAVLISIRDPLVADEAAPDGNDGDLAFSERAELVAFLNGFHLAKEAQSTGR